MRILFRRLIAGLSLTLLVALSVASGATAAKTPVVEPQWFSPTSFWNRPLAVNQAIAPTSGAVVGELIRQKDAYGGPWMNIEKFSIPVFTVGPNVPRVVVRDSDGGSPRADSPNRWAKAPVPSNAMPADGTDAHIVIWQPSSDTMWEFWVFQNGPNGPEARHGAKIPQVSRSAGIIEAPYGATASGLPAVGGLVTARDLRKGRIDHVLALAVPEVRRETLTLPATRTDGSSSDPSAPLEGARFRLDPKLDIDSLSLHPLARMLAKAAQRYGIVVRDQAGAVTFFGEDPRGVGIDRFTALIGDADREAVIESFPWDRLQMLPPRPFCCWQNWDYDVRIAPAAGR
jgi:hypothetical protein